MKLGLNKLHKRKNTWLLFLIVILSVEISCSIGTDKTEPLPEQSFSQLSNIEGSSSKLNDSANFKERITGLGANESAHPQLNKKLTSRKIVVPSEVEGKWNSVKILIQNKEDDELEAIHTLKLGSSMITVGSGLTLTVGSFLPNFVMDKKTYTSKGNKPLNPAVQLIVEESGKIIYEGWAFAKFPTMYKFEHKSISIKLLGAMPEVVS
jgi:hypothetical protein